LDINPALSVGLDVHTFVCDDVYFMISLTSLSVLVSNDFAIVLVAVDDACLLFNDTPLLPRRSTARLCRRMDLPLHRTHYLVPFHFTLWLA